MSELQLSEFLHIPECYSNIITLSAKQGTAVLKGALSPADLCITSQQPMLSLRPTISTIYQPRKLVAGNSSELQIETAAER